MHLPTGPSGPSDKSRTIALVLAFFLGVFGAHRFYAGKTGTAVLMLVTLGGLGIWWLYDLILVAAGGFRDDEGRLVSDWEPPPGQGDQTTLPAELLEELEELRAEVADLSDRVDFAERLLAKPREDVPRG